MSENEDCKACETIFAAHQDERPAILLSQLNALHSKYTLHVAGHVLAAAEERGRRKGVEERDELRALLRECEEAVREAVEDGSWSFRPLLAKIAALAPRNSAPQFPMPECPGPDCKACNGEACDLCGAGKTGFHGRCEHDVLERHQAPRDSVPVCDAVVSSDPFREWRCGKQKGHAGPHSGEAPRDSGACECICHGYGKQPYCAHCEPRDSGKDCE